MAVRTARQLKKGRETAIKRRTNWESSWRDAYRYALPQRDIMDNPVKGQQKGHRVFDSTAINSTQTAANRAQGDLFPPFSDFVEVAPGPLVEGTLEDQAIEEFDRASKVFHAAIHNSNFGVVINEYLLELMIGTACMIFEEGTDTKPFRFTAVPTPMVALEEGPYGTVGAVYRDHKDMTVDNIKRMWPDVKIPADWEKKATENPDTGFDFHEATYQDSDSETWYYELFREREEDKLLENERVYKDGSPWIITRYTKAANEVYGRGPLLYALPDVRTLNRTIELHLANASLSVTGAYTGVNDGVLNPNTAAIKPGVIIPVARNAGHPQGASLVPLDRSGNFDLTQIVAADLRGNIRRMLFDAGIPEQQGTPISATEMIARLKEFSVDTGPTFARIMQELVEPLVIRGMQILDKKGLITFPFQVDGTTIAVQVTSPLARKQAMDDIQNVMQALELSMFVGPELVNLNFKVEDIPRFIAQKLRVDPSLIRSQDEREELGNVVAETMAANQQPQSPVEANQQPRLVEA